ncbi:beta-defensin 135 [Molossus molossus]|uniref:Beta-defensin n=1 Tax=Molossus molossus TaxID=27622 RepID=A0A7J8I508_MOLMO|nr:beta-defensin 135 [Molossus molossus]KAF6479664.1 defensin beta 135 [Molossus molossus]
MRNLFLVLVILVLLSYVPPVRSGVNAYIRKLFATCWRLKGFCRPTCRKKEEYHIFCDTAYLCCIDKKDLPPVIESQ